MKFSSIILGSFIFPTLAFSYTFDSDVPSNIQSQIDNDLTFVKTIESNNQSDLHKVIFGSVSGKVYFDFFSSRVNEIGLNNCGSQNAVACVMPFFNSSKMWLTENYIKFSHPQIARMMVVFHEARHTERNHFYWQHATCPTPFLDANGNELKSIWTGASLAGEAACDETAEGSYGSSLIMMKNISKFCTNCSDKVKMDAGIYADDQFNRIIDNKARQEINHDLYSSNS